MENFELNEEEKMIYNNLSNEEKEYFLNDIKLARQLDEKLAKNLKKLLTK